MRSTSLPRIFIHSYLLLVKVEHKDTTLSIQMLCKAYFLPWAIRQRKASQRTCGVQFYRVLENILVCNRQLKSIRNTLLSKYFWTRSLGLETQRRKKTNVTRSCSGQMILSAVIALRNQGYGEIDMFIVP